MSGSDLQGRWMPSSITEEDILKLREAKYLAYEVSHRLPAQGQAVPALEPGEYVVFVSHLRRGLGFPKMSGSGAGGKWMASTVR